jgi:hypothetical protein
MPRGDGTGPMGMGPMTGRAAGYCAGYAAPGFANPMGGRGFGFWGRGRGRGFRHWFHATGLPGWMRGGAYAGPSPQADPGVRKQVLENQAEALQSELDAIKRQIAELDPSMETQE